MSIRTRPRVLAAVVALVAPVSLSLSLGLASDAGSAAPAAAHQKVPAQRYITALVNKKEVKKGQKVTVYGAVEAPDAPACAVGVVLNVERSTIGRDLQAHRHSHHRQHGRLLGQGEGEEEVPVPDLGPRDRRLLLRAVAAAHGEDQGVEPTNGGRSVDRGTDPGPGRLPSDVTATPAISRADVGLRSERGPILLAVMLSVGLVAIDATILATAVPAVVGDLGGFTQFPWLFSIYLLTQAVSVPLYSKLADQYGRKPMMLIGVASSWSARSSADSHGA